MSSPVERAINETVIGTTTTTNPNGEPSLDHVEEEDATSQVSAIIQKDKEARLQRWKSKKNVKSSGATADSALQ